MNEESKNDSFVLCFQIQLPIFFLAPMSILPKEKPQARLEKVDGGCEQTSEGGRDEAGKAGSNGKCSENNKNNQASRFPSYSTLVLGSVEDPGFLK